MSKLLRRLGHLLRHSRFEAELDEELEFHREMKQRELDLKGIDAPGAVQRELGNLTLVQDESRDVWIWRWLQSLAQDVRFACRLFTRDRGFAVTAVLVLAVGIGMTNAVRRHRRALHPAHECERRHLRTREPGGHLPVRPCSENGSGRTIAKPPSLA